MNNFWYLSDQYMFLYKYIINARMILFPKYVLSELDIGNIETNKDYNVSPSALNRFKLYINFENNEINISIILREFYNIYPFSITYINSICCNTYPNYIRERCHGRPPLISELFVLHKKPLSERECIDKINISYNMRLLKEKL